MSAIDSKAREIGRPVLDAAARVLARWNVSPDAVTLIGLILTVGVGILAGMGEIRWAGIVYVFAAICDAIDGTLARVGGKGSRFGAFLDSTIDRFEESIVFLGLIVHYARVGGLYEIPLVLVAAIGSLMVSYTRARAEALGVSCKVGFMTRVPRVAIMIVGMILDQVFIALILIAVTSLFTAFHRLYHVWRMTGGEEAGWAPAKDPFVATAPVVQEDSDSGDGS